MSDYIIRMPEKLKPVFKPQRGEVRYRCAVGGRGSGKSHTFAKMAVIYGAIEPLRILCTREIQESIKDSFHAELKMAIMGDPWLESIYDVGRDYIRGLNGTEFIFKGLRHNINSIKSMAKIDICIIEEAEAIPEQSWVDLEPTIRSEDSELWVVWNPATENSPVDKRFIKNTPPRCVLARVNYYDNPWFPAVLEEQRKHAQKVMSPETYAHIWEGAYLSIGDACIFKNKYRIDEFEPQSTWDGPYFGLDFGFSVDPTAAVKCWINDSKLYIEREAGGVGIELDDTAEVLKKAMPNIENYRVKADNSRPDSISYLKRHGLTRIIPCEKGKGSVEDGIEFIRSFVEVVIHTRCKETAKEFRLYSYKVDRHSNDIMPVPMDSNNHYIDALRYALEPIMKSRRSFFG